MSLSLGQKHHSLVLLPEKKLIDTWNGPIWVKTELPTAIQEDDQGHAFW